MNEKIDWYQEVLELEPGSKVFFPLAKLLAETGRFDEAVSTLVHGLDRHPEFFEARLYLVDLLYNAGHLEELRPHIEKLAPLLSRYAGFWQAWSAMPPENLGDGSVALAFLAHVFKQGPTNLGEALTRGLLALQSAPQPAPQPAAPAAAAPAPGESAPVEPDTLVITKFVELAPDAVCPDDPDELAAAPAGSDPLADMPGEAEPVAPSAASPDMSPPEAADVLPDVADAMAGLAEAVAGLDTSGEDMPEADMVTDMGSSLPGAEEVMAAALALEPEMPEAVAPAVADLPEAAPPDAVLPDAVLPDAVLPDAVLPGAGVEPVMADAASADAGDGEEHFTLRTRSMAEVLAEQGDYNGALEIYHELAAATDDAGEMADLEQRINTLKAHVGAEGGAHMAAPAGADAEAAGQSGATDARHRVISMLEKLADRLESRVH